METKSQVLYAQAFAACSQALAIFELRQGGAFITDANAAFCELLNCNREMCLGRALSQLLEMAGAPGSPDQSACLSLGQSIYFSLPAVRHASYDPGGDPVGLCVRPLVDDATGIRYALAHRYDEALPVSGFGALTEAPLVETRHILIVDDEPNMLNALRRLLRHEATVHTAGSAAQGYAALEQFPIGVVISDQRMSPVCGTDFLRQVRKDYPQTLRMVLSGYTELKSITDAINEGAIYKFLTKPWVDEQLVALVREAFEHYEALDKNRRLERQLKVVNERLSHLVHVQSSRIAVDESSLSVVHEVLTSLPLPVLGVDEGGLIVLANAAADALWPPSLLGQHMQAALPENFLALAMQDAGTLYTRGPRRFRAQARALGLRSASSGYILSFEEQW